MYRLGSGFKILRKVLLPEQMTVSNPVRVRYPQIFLARIECNETTQDQS